MAYPFRTYVAQKQNALNVGMSLAGTLFNSYPLVGSSGYFLPSTYDVVLLRSPYLQINGTPAQVDLQGLRNGANINWLNWQFQTSGAGAATAAGLTTLNGEFNSVISYAPSTPMYMTLTSSNLSNDDGQTTKTLTGLNPSVSFNTYLNKSFSSSGGIGVQINGAAFDTSGNVYIGNIIERNAGVAPKYVPILIGCKQDLPQTELTAYYDNVQSNATYAYFATGYTLSPYNNYLLGSYNNGTDPVAYYLCSPNIFSSNLGSVSPASIVTFDDASYNIVPPAAVTVSPFGFLVQPSASTPTSKLFLLSYDGTKYWPINIQALDASTQVAITQSNYYFNFGKDGTLWLASTSYTQLNVFKGTSTLYTGPAIPVNPNTSPPFMKYLEHYGE